MTTNREQVARWLGWKRKSEVCGYWVNRNGSEVSIKFADDALFLAAIKDKLHRICAWFTTTHHGDTRLYRFYVSKQFDSNEYESEWEETELEAAMNAVLAMEGKG